MQHRPELAVDRHILAKLDHDIRVRPGLDGGLAQHCAGLAALVEVGNDPAVGGGGHACHGDRPVDNRLVVYRHGVGLLALRGRANRRHQGQHQHHHGQRSKRADSSSHRASSFITPRCSREHRYSS